MSDGARPLKALLLLWLAGNALRLPILAIPPVLALIQTDLHLSGTEIGVLTGLPVILFAAVAVPGSLLIARVGAVPALVIGLLLAAIGSALRGLAPGIIALYATTILMGAGIAIMQPSLPPIVRAWLPTRIGFGTAVYTNGLLIGEALPVALTIPLVLPLFAQSWRASLVFWSVPLVLIALLVAELARPVAVEAFLRHGCREHHVLLLERISAGLSREQWAERPDWPRAFGTQYRPASGLIFVAGGGEPLGAPCLAVRRRGRDRAHRHRWHRRDGESVD